ncbi:MAG TPA: tetratricopeptide repeat protein [Terracidiphilus sp.]|nr:tetratricopeptide repeat protein [Terracidiphilus sp.]
MKRLNTQFVAIIATLLFSVVALAQQSAPVPPRSDQAPSAPPPSQKIESPAHKITNKERRQATKLYLQATKLFQKQQYEAAMKDYNEAARLDPENPNFAAATEVVRSHAVTELIQTATKARMKGDITAERAALQRAAELDPRNIQVAEHLREMADETVASQTKSLYAKDTESLAPAPSLEPVAGTRSFHLRTDRRQAIQNVFHSFGIEASVDSSVTGPPVRFEMDDATFVQAMQAINMVTDTFTVPLDAHRAIVAKDTREYRNQYMRQEFETVYLGGMPQAEMTDIGNMAKTLFQAQQVAVQLSSGTLTIRATPDKLNAFNETLKQLLAGKSQVLLDIKLLQVVHNNLRNTGITPPQQITAFNVYSEEQAILSQNQQLVQEIISSGLASPGDTLTILGILLASGQVSNSIFQNGIALFGGGLTLTGLSIGPARVNLNLNSSESRELDQIQMHLGDGEEGTIKSGSRYPIETSQYSDLGTSGINIPGLTSAGASGNLSSLLSQLNSGGQTIPQVEYQDLGLTFKATPRVIRSGEVALTMDLKITALGGTSINGVPILNNRSYSGVATVKDNAAVVLVSQVDKEESRALSGLPGLTEIPGLNTITNKEVTKNYASLLIVISPHVIRGTQPGGHTPMVRIERGRSAM